jgi:molybdenum cofactor synthesis domain-containing protein
MANDKKTVTAALLIIGNEILSGRTQDKNLAHIATTLNEVGVRLMEVRVIPDIEGEIVDAVNTLRRKFDYVFTTGGIGPTHDDITAESVAKAFGRKLIVHPEAFRRMDLHYKQMGREMNEARLRMAKTPEGATLIDNPISTAPGFNVENVYVMAGVPSIMQAMLEGIKGGLAGGAKVLSRTVLCTLGEGDVAAGLAAIQKAHPDMDIGSYPQYSRGNFRVSLVVRGTDPAALDGCRDEVMGLIRSLGGVPQSIDAEEEAANA